MVLNVDHLQRLKISNIDYLFEKVNNPGYRALVMIICRVYKKR